MPFRDRVDAGRQLAQRLLPLRGPDVVVLGLPRGGVPVAAEVARALHAPFDVIVVRKLGVPVQPELAMGAIGEGGVRVINDDVVRLIRIDDAGIERVEEHERAELQRRARRFRGDRPPLPLMGRTAIVVDDGIATGSTAAAACRVARAHGAARIILAVPVASPDAVRALRQVADEVIALDAPEHINSVGQWYQDFSQTSDDDVVALLEQARRRDSQPPVDSEVEVAAGPVRLPGQLTVPARARGVVVFAHGSGSSRHSPRNRLVAEVLNRAALGTLLFDLLTADEEHDRRNVFDIGLLGARLVATAEWLRARPEVRDLPIAYFGASTGAGAALWAAAEPGADIAAVVSRGGRPDLAGKRLPFVVAPTLLIVGGHDEEVLDLNQRAAALLQCEHRVVVVPGATHLFEEPGTLQAAAELARDWLLRHTTPT
jgi:putative phosphoribosyl transferase